MSKLWIILLLALSYIIVPAQSRWKLSNDSTYLAFLMADYKSYKLEGGYFLAVRSCSDCNKNSIPLSITYHDPIDYGDILFSYNPTNDTVFYGTIVWAGSGSLIKPKYIIPADSFKVINDSVNAPLSIEYYLTGSYFKRDVFIRKADSAWNALKNLDIAKSFSMSSYDIGIYLYTPAVGILNPEGVFWPDNAKWIVFLYRPGIMTDVDDCNISLPSIFSLGQNYPNPFNPATKISYSLHEGQYVELTVYDMLGKKAAQLVNEYKSAGIHTVRFFASSLPSGIYIYRIHAGKYSESRKLIIMK